jgi:glutamate racemase
VERVETGDLEGEQTRALLAGYLAPLLERGVDAIVLGCTHYPHLSPLIGELAGPGVAVLDSGIAVARQLRRRLETAGLIATAGRPGSERFWTSGSPEETQGLMRRLWHREMRLERLPEGPAQAQTPPDNWQIPDLALQFE